jgi:multidrug efflux pump subunit AcrA (membrane-fusion protein)
VTDIGAKRGAHVKKGELIVQLDVRDLQARLQQSRALVYQRKIQYDAAERLKSKNYQSQTNVAEARADLEAARAAAKRVEVEISNSVVAGGLTFATLLTLVLTPSLLVLGERLKFGRRNTAQAQLPESTSALQERA